MGFGWICKSTPKWGRLEHPGLSIVPKHNVCFELEGVEVNLDEKIKVCLFYEN